MQEQDQTPTSEPAQDDEGDIWRLCDSEFLRVVWDIKIRQLEELARNMGWRLDTKREREAIVDTIYKHVGLRNADWEAEYVSGASTGND